MARRCKKYYASLDGNVYFIDLETGKKTRNPININNPIKGSVALDPKGYPLLYVWQGISEKGQIGYRIFSLIDGKELYFINEIDSVSHRGWGAFDGSPLINRESDSMILGGENGIVYDIKLNTKFDKDNKKISLNPQVLKYRYEIKGNNYQGIENSVAVYKNLAYFADNGGQIQYVNLQNMKPVWTFNGKDDTELMVALNKKTGEEIWRYEMPNYSWSSPVDIYDDKGKGYLIQGDSIGNLTLIDGKTGQVLNAINLVSNIESSPAVYNNILVVATRWGKIYGVNIE